MKIAMLAHAGAVHTRRWGAGLAMRGHDVRILSNTDFLGYPEEITTHLLPGKTSLSYVSNIPRVRKILNRFAPDIVHAHYATGYGLWGFMQKSAPLIVSVWGTDIADALAGKRMITPIVRRALNAAHFVTATSRYLMDQTVRFEPSVRDKLVYVPFGVPTRVPEETPAKSGGSIRIIFAKQFHPTYAPELVLRSFARACRINTDLHLTMIGGGPLYKRLIRLAKSLDVTSRVYIRGWVEMLEAESLIAQSDIMVMPSERESFGVAALEACSACVPVIATKVGGIPEIIENGSNGILIDVGNEEALTNAIVKLSGDPALRQQMGEAGRKIARERFDFDASLDLMEELYRKISGK